MLGFRRAAQALQFFLGLLVPVQLLFQDRKLLPPPPQARESELEPLGFAFQLAETAIVPPRPLRRSQGFEAPGERPGIHAAAQECRLEASNPGRTFLQCHLEASRAHGEQAEELLFVEVGTAAFPGPPGFAGLSVCPGGASAVEPLEVDQAVLAVAFPQASAVTARGGGVAQALKQGIEERGLARLVGAEENRRGLELEAAAGEAAEALDRDAANHGRLSRSSARAASPSSLALRQTRC